MSIIERFHQGGLFMWVILTFFIFTIGFIVERGNVLYFKLKEIPSTFRDKILNYLVKGDFKGAEREALAFGKSNPIGRITAVGCHLRAQGGGEEEIQARMDEHLAKEISKIDRRTGFLAMFGNVATLVGLLGTIVGMIKSFASVAAANPVDRATLLSQGISEAMNCTAFGLLTAIPALVAYAIYQNRTERVISDITETTTEVFHDLLFLTENNDNRKHDPRTLLVEEEATNNRSAVSAGQPVPSGA